MKSKISPFEFITKNISSATNTLAQLKVFIKKQIQDIMCNYQSYCLGLDALQLLTSNFYISADDTLNKMSRVAITGDFGTGKTLLLLKLYMSMAQSFLEKNTFDSDNDAFPILLFAEDINRTNKTSMTALLKSLGLEDAFHQLNYCVFLDGIDEIVTNYDVISSISFVNRVKYFTCRECNLNKFKMIYSNFNQHKIYKWTDDDVDIYIRQYLIAQNINNNIIDNVIHVVHNESELAGSPLLLTLFLNSICRDEIIPEHQKFSSSIIIEQSLRSFLFSEIKKNHLTINVENAFQIIVNANWAFVNNASKGIITEDKLINFLYTHFKSKISKNNIKAITKSFFSSEEVPVQKLRLHMHKRISEYLLAKYVYNIISQNINSSDALYDIHMSFSIMDLLIELINLNPQKSELWIKDTLQRISKPYDILFGICIFLLCRIFYNSSNERNLINGISKLDDYQKIIVYDQIIQYSSNNDIRCNLEDEYYSFLNSNIKIIKLNIGIRLYYVGAINNFDDYLRGDEIYTTEDVECLIEKYNQHFSEELFENKHYILRRIELFTLNEIAKDHAEDEIRRLIMHFALSHKDKILANQSKCDFDNKVLICFNNLLRTLNICD